MLCQLNKILGSNSLAQYIKYPTMICIANLKNHGNWYTDIYSNNLIMLIENSLYRREQYQSSENVEETFLFNLKQLEAEAFIWNIPSQCSMFFPNLSSLCTLGSEKEQHTLLSIDYLQHDLDYYYAILRFSMCNLSSK